VVINELDDTEYMFMQTREYSFRASVNFLVFHSSAWFLK